MTKTIEAVVRRRWLPPEYAVREVVAFERRFGEKHLALACHAALPLILTPELVNLIRINFLDSEDIPWIAESDLLLSPLCRPIQEDIYEVEPCVREVLLVELEDKFGWRIPLKLAELLQLYLEKQPDWKQTSELTRTQKWIAKTYLDPDSSIQELTDDLDGILPEDNPVLGLPGQSYFPQLVEILAEPLERTILWDEHQYLLNTTRALAKLLAGEREGLREEVEVGEGELMLISPVISQLVKNAENKFENELVDWAYVEEESIIPPSDLILNELNINPSTIKSIKPPWKRSRYRAVVNWITKYKFQPSATNLEKIQGLLESFHHLCELEDWETARKILVLRLETPTQEELYNQLGTWGYYHQQINLCNQLLAKLSPKLDIELLTTLGSSYYALGDYSRAIDYLEQVLRIAREIGDLQGEGAALGSLGQAYNSIGNTARGIEFCQQHLDIAREIGDRQGESIANGNLGRIYDTNGDFVKAVDYYQQSLTIARQIGDRQTESSVLGNLGDSYCSLEDYDKAIKCHQQQLGIAKQIGDRSGEGAALGGLGNVYYSLHDYTLAIKHHQQWLDIAREIGNRKIEGSALGGLGRAYEALENYSLALEHYQQWLKLSREIGDRDGESRALENLGSVYYNLSDYRQAINYCEQSLVIVKVIGNGNAEIRIILGLGNFYYSLEEYAQGIDYFEKALVVIRASNARSNSHKETSSEEAEALEYLGVGYGNLKQYSQAINYFEEYLKIIREIGDYIAEGIALQNLSFAYSFLGDKDKSYDYLQQSLIIAVKICNNRSVEELESDELEYLSRVLPLCREIGDSETESIITGILYT